MGSAICNGTPARPLMLWCPYCDKVLLFQTYEYYWGVYCHGCGRGFPPHTWPKGFDIKTGELEMDKEEEWLSKCPLRKDYLSEYAWLGAKIDWLVDRPKFEYPPEDGD